MRQPGKYRSYLPSRSWYILLLPSLSPMNSSASMRSRPSPPELALMSDYLHSCRTHLQRKTAYFARQLPLKLVSSLRHSPFPRNLLHLLNCIRLSWKNPLKSGMFLHLLDMGKRPQSWFLKYFTFYLYWWHRKMWRSLSPLHNHDFHMSKCSLSPAELITPVGFHKQ